MSVQVQSDAGADTMTFPVIEPLQGKSIRPRTLTKAEPSGRSTLPLLTTFGQKRPLEFFSTGVPDLDLLLGGGLPKGRIIEAFGGESSGKTSFGVKCLAQAQKAGGVGALIEPENSLDPGYAVRLGVDLDHLLYGLPQNGDAAIQLIGELIDQNACDLIALDSIAALLPRLEDGTFYDDSYKHAYLLSQGLKFLNSKLAKADRLCTLLFTNQLRFSGGKNTPTGGQAMGFFASLRLEFKKGAALKQGNTVIGSKVLVSVRKSKVGATQGSLELNLLSGQGLVSNSIASV